MPKPFLTPPATIPEAEECRSLQIPSSKEWLGIFNSALLETMYYWNWEQVNDTDLTPQEAADKCREIVYAYFDAACGSGMIPAPYWEDGSEADDLAPPDEQQWYGYVSEGNFIEDVGVWLISNFLAASVHPKAATLYATNERKVRLAFLEGGPAKVVSIYANDVLAQVVNLAADGDIVQEVDVLTGYVDEAVEILTIIEEVV